MKTALFISPHLDDAVFSCAGMIRHLVADGWKVVVATVFTEGSAEHELRRAEDIAASQALGFEAVHLGFRDAPFRQPGHAGYTEILFGWNEQDDTMVTAVATRLRALMSDVRPDRVLAPLGVGEHVDHRIVFEAMRPHEGLEFYEERPYTYARGAAELRLRRLGAQDMAFDAARLLEDWRDLPFVRLYASGEELLPAPADANEVLSANSKLLRTDLHAACATARCYASQYEAFCGDEATHLRLEKRHGLSVGGTAERWERTWILRTAGNNAMNPRD